MTETTAVVINACYGGFGLSHEAILRYAEIKGITVYHEKGKYPWENYYWTCPTDKRPEILSREFRDLETLEERVAWNEAWSQNQIYDRDIPRDDPALAQVVRELGDKANGMCAKLRVVELTKGTLYRIDEYDGFESIETNFDITWRVA